MNILIFRLSAIGDIIMASGILPCIKEHFPKSKVTWVVQEEYKGLVESSPYVDLTVPIKRKELSYLFKKGRISEFIKEVKDTVSILRKNKYKLILDLQGIWKSGIWALLCKGENRVVVDPKEGIEFLYRNKVLSNSLDKRIGAEYKVLLDSLGIPGKHFKLGIGAGSPGVELPDKFVVFCPFTTRPQKFWVNEYWMELAHHIGNMGYTVVLLGGPGDRHMVEKIFPNLSGIVDLVGKLGLTESIGVIEKSTAIIGVDTGLTHAGMLLQKPTIAIFGSTCPYLETEFEKGVVLYDKLDCSPCKRNPTCNGDITCMRRLTPDRVISTLSRLI